VVLSLILLQNKETENFIEKGFIYKGISKRNRGNSESSGVQG
jgi:hypothetical protein